jgi:5-formyltetrahydrofolate cyclo-ligase
LIEDVQAWRQATRAELIARRMAIEPEQRRFWSDSIARHLLTIIRPRERGILGIYWPFKGEFDPRPWLPALMKGGWRLALPVVVGKIQPLRYRDWTPDAPLERGVLGIMIPSQGDWVTPDTVLAPLVGFDAQRYRLGNGGGYFDRTLAALDSPPYAIGVGFALARLATVHPQPHDRRMNAIVTEEGILR